MDIPLQVTFRHLPQSPALQERIRDKASKLHSPHPLITTCRVTVVSFDENEDVQVALREAFAAAHRQLEGA